MTKAHATVGFWIMQVAAFAGYVLAGALMAADQLRTSYGVDVVQHIVFGQAIVNAAYYIGKAIFENRAFMDAEAIPESENPPEDIPDPA